MPPSPGRSPRCACTADGSPLRGKGRRPAGASVERSRAVRAHGGSTPMPTWLIWVIVIVVVLVVIGALVSMMNKRRTEQHRARAEELRAEASAKAGGLTESQRAADE